jgi:hypothetical protein
MGKGNKKQVTIGHNPIFSSIFKKHGNQTSFFGIFAVSVADTCSQRNKLLLRKEDGLFPVFLVSFWFHVFVQKVFNI